MKKVLSILAAIIFIGIIYLSLSNRNANALDAAKQPRRTLIQIENHQIIGHEAIGDGEYFVLSVGDVNENVEHFYMIDEIKRTLIGYQRNAWAGHTNREKFPDRAAFDLSIQLLNEENASFSNVVIWGIIKNPNIREINIIDRECETTFYDGRTRGEKVYVLKMTEEWDEYEHFLPFEISYEDGSTKVYNTSKEDIKGLNGANVIYVYSDQLEEWN